MTRGADRHARERARAVAGAPRGAADREELGRDDASSSRSRPRGDELLDVPLAEVGGKGLFVKEIEQALLDGRADVAVHSAKDLPGGSRRRACARGVPRARGPARRAVAPRGGAARRAAARARASARAALRRSAQLLRARPDLEIAPLRGNVPTRLAKLERESLDAVVLACAGLDRLGLADRIAERIDPARDAFPRSGRVRSRSRRARGDPLARGARGARGSRHARRASPPSARSRRGSAATATCRSARTRGSTGDASRCACGCSSPTARAIERAVEGDAGRSPSGRARRGGAGARGGRRARCSRRCARGRRRDDGPRDPGRRGPRRAGSHHRARRRRRCAAPTPSSTTRSRRRRCSISRRPDALRIDVGKRGHDEPTRTQEETTALLLRLAAEGRTVVRLKGGDPYIFGRGGEEASACAARGHPVRGGAGRVRAVRRARLRGHPDHRSAPRRVVRRRDRPQGSRPRSRARRAGTCSRAPPTRSWS